MSVPAPPPHESRPRRSSTVVLVAVALVLLLVLVGAGLTAWAAASFLNKGVGGPLASPPEPSGTAEMPSFTPDLATYYEQKLKWRDCGPNQCSRLEVPLDYTNPDGKTIELAVLRSPALRRSERIGQLVVNPGGPGGSSINYASSGSSRFGNQVARYYDIIGVDPRGVGESTPLECAGTRQLDELIATDPDPDTPAEVDDMERLLRETGQGCLDRKGELARHISTVEAAKDLDILRAALGERQLDYLGASYGTFLGATYADLFPTRVRRMVLDGALDPALSWKDLMLGQARGFETALRAYLKDCVDAGDCFLGDTVDAAADRIQRLFEEIDQQPLETESGRELTEGLAQYGVFMPLYVKSYWSLLTLALQQALNGKGDQLLALADTYASRGENGYSDNAFQVLYAVNCLDHGDFTPYDEVPALFPEFEKASPTFGRIFAYSTASCASWPPTGDNVTQALDAEGAPPILVIGTTRDPATPYEWAQSLAAQLDSGVLISRDGDGHTGFQMGNDCVDSAVERYLLSGKPPRDDLSC